MRSSCFDLFHPLAYKTNNEHLPKPFFKVIRKSLSHGIDNVSSLSSRHVHS